MHLYPLDLELVRKTDAILGVFVEAFGSLADLRLAERIVSVILRAEPLSNALPGKTDVKVQYGRVKVIRTFRAMGFPFQCPKLLQ